MTGRTLSTRSAISLVAKREIVDRLRNRAYLIGIAITAMMLGAVIVVPSLLSNNEPVERELAVTAVVNAELGELLVQAAASQDGILTISVVDDDTAARGAVAGGVDGALLRDSNGDELVLPGRDARLLDWVEGARTAERRDRLLAEADVEPSVLQNILAPADPVTVTRPGTESGTAVATDQEEERGQNIAFLATVLLFLTIQINAGTLLTGTIEEKTNRIVEVLLGSIRPWQLLSGKLLAVSLLAFGQLTLYIGVMLGGALATGSLDLPAAAGDAIAVGLLMFVLGFGFFAALYAVAGALSSSVEDAQSSAGPLGFMVLGVYLSVIVGVIPNPDGLLARVFTFLPPTAPFAVPARVSTSSISGLEIVGGAVATAIGTAIVVRIAGRLYAAAILAGSRVRWRDVIRLEPIE